MFRAPFPREGFQVGVDTNPVAAYYAVADTEAERPATGAMGDLCFTKDTKKLWTWHTGQWNDSAGVATAGPHTHPISDVTGLQAALDGKAATIHTHPDPWTYARLSSDVQTSSATAVDVTGLAFSPLANTVYQIEALLLRRTATATVNPRCGWAWASGMTDGAMEIRDAQTVAGGVLFAYGNPNAALLTAAGGVPNTTQSWPANYVGMVVAGASPSGTCRVQLASETAGTIVTVKAGSFLRWRVVP